MRPEVGPVPAVSGRQSISDGVVVVVELSSIEIIGRIVSVSIDTDRVMGFVKVTQQCLQ